MLFGNKDIMDYQVLIPPLKKPVCELSHSETDAYFNWFIDNLETRTEYLASVISKDITVKRSKIDRSPESLITVWKWFLKTATVEMFPDGETNSHRFSLVTEYVIRDIGMYLGLVFTYNNNNITWTYYETPKSDYFVNMPVLQGFQDRRFDPPFNMYFEPIHMTHIQASRLIKGKQGFNDLYDLYSKWIEKYT